METEALDNRFHRLLEHSRNSGAISVESYLELARVYEKFGPVQAMEDLMELLRSNGEITRQSSSDDEEALMFSVTGFIISVIIIALFYLCK
jgi:hypothetical protein